MKGPTGALYLDQFQALGIEGREHAETYPPLTASERVTCDAFAAGLYLSKSLVQWSLYRWRQNQDRSGFDRILQILSAGRLKRLTPA